jgi:hypothetical protein
MLAIKLFLPKHIHGTIKISRALLVCIYIYIPWNIVLLEKLTIEPLDKKLPALYKTRIFVAVLTRAHQ